MTNCTNCEVNLTDENKVNKRNICKKCYNDHKLKFRHDKYPKRTEQCTKCKEITLIGRGSTWCNPCQNQAKKERLSIPENRQKRNAQEREGYQRKKEEIAASGYPPVKEHPDKKTCSGCNIEKNIDEFHIHNAYGRYREKCKTCASIARKKYYETHKERTIKKTTAYTLNRMKVDEGFKWERRARSLLYCALKRRTNYKNTKTVQIVGCEISVLRKHMEDKFKEGMTWDNYGSKWVVDHVKPCALFDFTKDEDKINGFHYTNLQPLWPPENLEKGAKYEPTE